MEQLLLSVLFYRQQILDEKEQKRVEVIQRAQAQQADRLALIYSKSLINIAEC